MRRAVPFLVAFLLAPAAADAVGFMFVAHGGRDYRGDLMRLDTLAAQVTIRQRLAITRLDQVFHNHTERIVEGVYEFALPEGAVITDLVLWIGDRRVQGQIREKEEARREYEELVSRAVDPALAEQVGDRHFRLSIYPFPPGGNRRIELEYLQVLKAEAGVATYTFPLGRDDDVSVEIGRVQLRVDVTSGVPFRAQVGDPYRAISLVAQASDTTATVTLVDQHLANEAQWILDLEEDPGLSRPRVMSQAPMGDEDGYYALWLPPLPELKAAGPATRAISFLLDISSSMRGDRLAAAKEALRQVLEALGPGDLFNIVAFSSYAERFRPTLVPASVENLDAARDFIRLQGALGATNLEAALARALSVPAPEAVHQLIIITDGRPSVGMASAASLRALVERWDAGARLHAIGVGDQVDRALLQVLARDLLGQSVFVDDSGSLAAELRSLLERFLQRDFAVNDLAWIGTEVTQWVPERIPLLNADREELQVGRYTVGGDLTLRVRGRIGAVLSELAWPVRLAAASPTPAADSAVARLWALRMVEALEDQLTRSGPDEAISARILQLGLTYRLVTSRTSLYAPDPEIAFTRPEDQDCETCGGGATAVESGEAADMMVWLGRTFARGEQGWVDLSYKAGMPRREYRGDGPVELARFAAIGEPLLVVVGGTAWDIPPRPTQPLVLGNVPNPFNGGTTILCSVPPALAGKEAILTVFDLVGQAVWDAHLPAAAGEHRVVWDGRDRLGRPAATGVYLCRVAVEGRADVRRMILVR